MKNFETFDPRAWMDEIFVGEAPSEPTPPRAAQEENELVAWAGRAVTRFVGEWVLPSAVVAGIAVSSVAIDSASASAWALDRSDSMSTALHDVHVTSTVRRAEPTPIEPWSAVSMDDAWSRALSYLGAQGEDVPALLEKASANLSHWKGREEPFPTTALIESERTHSK